MNQPGHAQVDEARVQEERSPQPIHLVGRVFGGEARFPGGKYTESLLGSTEESSTSQFPLVKYSRPILQAYFT